MNPDQSACTCTWTAKTATFDPACPYHGDNGSMVALMPVGRRRELPICTTPAEGACRTCSSGLVVLHSIRLDRQSVKRLICPHGHEVSPKSFSAAQFSEEDDG